MDEKIRTATVDDAAQILKIYSYYVENTAISFEWITPTLDEFILRIKNISKKYPYIVATRDEKIIGYAYAHEFVDRAAYDWSVETTIYLDKDERHKGVGKKLYTELENNLREMGILNLYAKVAYTEIEDEYLTNASAKFHEHLGFKTVGKLKNCGNKFGRWYDMIVMEKIIGEHFENPNGVKFYDKHCDFGNGENNS